jgi:hypothetical protein
MLENDFVDYDYDNNKNKDGISFFGVQFLVDSSYYDQISKTKTNLQNTIGEEMASI